MDTNNPIELAALSREPSSLFLPEQGRPVSAERFHPKALSLAMLTILASATLLGAESAMPETSGMALDDGAGGMGPLPSTTNPNFGAGRFAVSSTVFEGGTTAVAGSARPTGTMSSSSAGSSSRARSARKTTRYSERLYPFVRSDMVADAARAATPTSGDSAIDALLALKPLWPRSLRIKYTILDSVDKADRAHTWHAEEIVRHGQPGCDIAVGADWAAMIEKILEAVSDETPFNFVAAQPGEITDLLVAQACFTAPGLKAKVTSPSQANLNAMQFDARADLPGLIQNEVDSPLRGINLLQFDPGKFRSGSGSAGSEAWWGIQHEVLHTLGLMDIPGPFWSKAGEPLQDDLQHADMTNMAYGFERGDASDTVGRTQYPQTLGPLDLGVVDHVARNLGDGDTADLYERHPTARGAEYKFFPNGDIERLIRAQGATRGMVLSPAAEGHVQRSMLTSAGADTTYDFSGIKDTVSVNLEPGGETVYAPQRLAQARNRRSGATMVSKGNVYQPRMTQDTRCMVANLKTGQGSGRYTGNAADNAFDITPGSGRDTLSGAAGKDRYRFSGRKNVTITDFTVGAGGDMLQIDHGMLVGDLARGATLGTIRSNRETQRLEINFDRGGYVELHGSADIDALFAHNLQFVGAHASTQPAQWSALFRNTTEQT